MPAKHYKRVREECGELGQLKTIEKSYDAFGFFGYRSIMKRRYHKS